MAPTPLARLVDRDALDASKGARATLRIAVPAAWLDEGAHVEIAAPVRLACAGCDGGGCDACARSGAFRAPEVPADRVLRAQLPAASGAVALRLVRPFGPSSAIEQIVLEVRAGATPSAGVRRLATPRRGPLARGTSGAALPWRAIAAALVLAAVLAALLHR